MVDVSNLDIKFEGYLKLPFIIVKMGNLDAILWGYLDLCFIMIKVYNLDANLGLFELSNLYTNLGDYSELSCVLAVMDRVYS